MSSAPATPPAVIAPAPDGTLGAWLVAGTFDRDRLPDEVALSPSLDGPLSEPGGAARWKLATASTGGSGPVDLLAALGPQGHDRLGYAGGVLHLEHGGYHTFLFGSDDGAALYVDGHRVAARDEPRTRRDDEDVAGLDLAAGDHTVVLAALHRGGAWGFRLRVLDAGLEPPAQGRWVLPGTTSSDAQAMASRMSLLTFDRGPVDEGYRGSVTVRFPG
ncbi:MAG: hypothetical protein ACRENE_11940, partial [Polyangiaceae bacterium]